ncbi:MAG: enoyl-[acyl-carrier-protein] reductase [Polyangiaceae bacterium]|nr:enoyl-[acyl-carrier-protein] reductase [Polyangiaceae bacterium]
MMKIDLTGKRALVAGVADSTGFGFSIAKSLAEAGATVCVGTWPPALNIFRTLLRRGKMDEALTLSDGSKMEFEKIYALDAAFDTLDDVPEDIKTNKRYAKEGDYTVGGLAKSLVEDFGDKPLDILVHSLANGPDVQKLLIDTSRKGYLAAVNVSSFSLVSMVSHLGPLMREGGSAVSLTYLAGERVIPGYGGGMSSAKAALESDTRVLAFEAGRRYGMRINTISAGPYASRAASVTGVINEIIEFYKANSPLEKALDPSEVGNTAAFLASGLASAITASTVYVDNGYHAMGKAL